MYNTDTYKEPFWAENSGFMTGRDPLGIQNSSISLYASLLPGMTNLTLRIRYYGMYCWLLKEYGKLNPDLEEKTLLHHYNFFRRAELTIAFIMHRIDPLVTSVVGSDYTSRHMQEFLEQGWYNIAVGADKTGEKPTSRLYWDYTSGALGQYYAGSLINLELIETSSKFFLLKDKGKELAEAYEQSISKEARNLFLEIIKEGVLHLAQVDLLKEFMVNSIIPATPEWNFYKEIMLQNDGRSVRVAEKQLSSNRRETIRLYLEFLDSGIGIKSFPEFQFRQIFSNSTDSSTSFGWYYYYLNEAIHFCIETIFWGMLEELDGKQIPVRTYIKEIASIILEHNHRNVGFDPSEKLEELLLKLDPVDLPEEQAKLIKLTASRSNSNEAMGFSVILFLQCYLFTRGRIQDIADFEKKYFLFEQKGNISEFMTNYVDEYLSFTYAKYIEKIIGMIINDHIATAYRKMGNGEANLLKFVIEDDLIGHIQTMTPRFTTPRIQTLRNIMFDLGNINKEGRPTEAGYELIIELS